MTLRATILGCGSSGGVPRVGGDWGACDPDEPKNRRMRCSLLVEKDADGGTTSILVDTSPDLREQLLRADVKRLDAVLYTHDHADQTHGIDDLRAIAYRMRTQIPVYMDAHTKEHLVSRFDYCFEMPEGRVHPAILALQDLVEDGRSLTIDGPGGPISVDVVEASHGPTPTLLFVFDGKIAYSPDVWEIEEDRLERLTDIDCWICDALRYSSHPTHAHADKTLSWMARVKARRAILTNLHIDMDYDVMRDELPAIAQPAYDGMVVESL
ncbi:MBL fold metallo-hydrolase [uncultured Algimonas sp.]|uniref:MBL fold metallo-hydrolase n=1 Tax=uncultured Algimonas sp. TaxID=1547920 RepID=UPI00261CD6F9|nr:MBL fold metallo-hydrolase [uncultured Algimonas sp.]